jgi:hypothetical protein
MALPQRRSTRTFLELRVGNTHTLEVLLHLRQKDRAWFGSEQREEVLQLLTARVLPREFDKEVEAYHEKLNGTAVPKVGEKNNKSQNQINQPSKKKGAKRKRKAKAAPPPPVPEEKPRRDVRHVFGDNVQLTYRLEEIGTDCGATLSISYDNGDLVHKQYPKLSKRLVVWCFPSQEGDSTDQDPTDGGFPRPELIPIAALFQQDDNFT